MSQRCVPGSGGRGRSGMTGPMPKIPIVGNALPNEGEEEDIPLQVEKYFEENDDGSAAPPTVDDKFRENAAGMDMEFEVD